jgi:diacylglycerol kinase family enzyme
MGARVGIILNPTSGPRPHTAEEVLAIFQELGFDPDIRAVADGAEVAGATRALVQDGHTTVFVAGGDGTVSAAAGALSGTGATLGVLPTGTLNHLARDLGLPASLPQAARAQAAAGTRAIDVGEVNGRVFLNNVSLGLYPAFVRARGHTRRLPRVRKWLRAAGAVLALFVRFPMLRARITVDGRALRRRTPIIFIGNNEYVIDGPGLGMRPALDGGRLSLLLTRRRGPWGVVMQIVRASRGTLRGSRDIEETTGCEIVVGSRRGHIHAAIDGEVVTLGTPLKCRVRPGALRVLWPGAPADGQAAARGASERATLRA